MRVVTRSKLHPWLAFDVEEARDVVTRFLSEHRQKADKEGYVVGLSGGLDSATSAAMAAEAVGTDRIKAVYMPGPASSEEDFEHAEIVASGFGFELQTVPIGEGASAVADAIGVDLDRHAVGNVKARVRMVALYALAEAHDALVLGTGNKSELLTGYFTKHGDGAADVVPLGDVYKMQVRRVARELDVPEEILQRAPSAGLWAGQTDEEELGLGYDVLDVVLAGIEQQFDEGKIAEQARVETDEVHRVKRMVRTTQHKRNPPPVPKLGWRTVGVDWREPTSP